MTRKFRDLLEESYAALARCRRPAMPDTPDEWMEELCEGDDCVLSDFADMGGQVRSVGRSAPVDVFMDFDFVRFMLEIDPVLLSHGDEYRGLYRLAMKGVLPERIRTRQDKASFEPAIGAAALAAGALDWLRDLASLRSLAEYGLVDPGPFLPLFERWMGAVHLGERTETVPGDESCHQVWQLLSLEAFLREHGTGRELS